MQLTRWKSSSRALKRPLASNLHRNWRLQLGKLTSGTLGVVLDVLALLDELVVGGAGEAALGSSAGLSGEPRGVTDGLASSKHGDVGC